MKMKEILKEWRQFINKNVLKESKESSVGLVHYFEEDRLIKIVLINVKELSRFLNTMSIKDVIEELKDDYLANVLILGYIEAEYNPHLLKVAQKLGVDSITGQPGGKCSNTYSVKKSIGRGYGKFLYNALLGFAGKIDAYVTSDKNAVSLGARRRWKKIDDQTDEEVPSKNDGLSTFDSSYQTETEDDDCFTWGEEHLDKGYKDSKQIAFFDQLKNNFDSSIETKLQPKKYKIFDKIFGNEQSKLEKALLDAGSRKFKNWLHTINDPD